jgi:DNA-binding transcriptional MerR regulator
MRISEVIEQWGVSPDTPYYYERIGLLPPVNQNNEGIRDYGELDLRQVEFIRCKRSVDFQTKF